MKQYLVTIIILAVSFFTSNSLFADSSNSYFFYIKNKETPIPYSKYHYGYLKGIEVKITPEKLEIPSGSIATFTVTLTNKNKYPITIDYPTGREWDMFVTYNERPIFRWSNGFRWEEAPHSIALMPKESRSQTFTWVAVNKTGDPLYQGIYKCVGLVTSSPKIIVSNAVKIRLTPPSVVARKTIKTNLNQCFEIELPRFSDNQELKWEIIYRNNDNRIGLTSKKIKSNSFVYTFMPKRLGHVEFDLYAFPHILNNKVSLERRSYRIEVE